MTNGMTRGDSLHQQLDVPLFKQVLATALERAIERADFNR